MKLFNNEKGFVAFLLTTLVMAVIGIMSLTIFISSTNEQKIIKNLTNSTRAYYAAEAGIEDALYRLKKQHNLPANYQITIGTGTVTVSVNAPSQNNKIITAASNFNNVFRRIEAKATTDIINPEFFYGAQTGTLGIVMENNSRIEGAGGASGNVYSNGPIDGEGGAAITGDVFVATGISELKDVTVMGDVHANTIINSKICGDAHYQTIDQSSLNFLNSPRQPTCKDPLTPGTAFPGSSDPPIKNLPISNSNINQWKAEATQAGVLSGNLDVTSNMSFGPKKIEGNLLMTSTNKTLTLTGTIYITGYVDIDNGSTIRCSSSYGLNSCLIVTDKWVHIKNNGIFSGSGQSGSYIMILSDSRCDGTFSTQCTHHDAAIDLHNNATGAIFYTNDGLIYLHNGVQVSELVAKKINLQQNALIQYERGLIDASFSSGPGAGWRVASWKEIE